MSQPASTPPHNPYHDSPAKETVISMIISLALALVAKSYIVEAFVIPTGSMAPTLLGQHMLYRSPQSGYEWAVNPLYFRDPDTQQVPFEVQGGGANQALPTATDPMSTSRVNGWQANAATYRVMSGYAPPPQPKRARAGDRILVHKWLYEVFEPSRFDVVVFKNPENPSLNYIKRLLGLPNEQVWLADGDVFVRPRPKADAPAEAWKIQRKPDRIQRSLWRTIFSSEYTPEKAELGGTKVFESPWTGNGWETASQDYRTAQAESALSWNTGSWPIWDWVPYNDTRDSSNREKWPVSDLRLRAGVRPEAAGLTVAATITARRHQFQGSIEGGKAILRMRPFDASVPDGVGAWEELASAPVPSSALKPGRVTNLEFWHADQRLELWVDDARVVMKEYDWDALTRIANVTGPENPNVAMGPAKLHSPGSYEDGRTGTAAARLPGVEWSFKGSGVTLHRVGLDRDVYYEPTARGGLSGLGTTDLRPANLGPDQFFCCGDNSPNSFDGRMWRTVNPWLASEIDATPGIVHRKMMLGKAFFVYFPAPFSLFERVPIPDFGRMRFIR